MVLCRLILPDWAMTQNRPKVIEDLLTDEQIIDYNVNQNYNVYYFPNGPKKYQKGAPLVGSDIDDFQYVFVDMDSKDGVYTVDSFLEYAMSLPLTPAKIVTSGNGVHIYFKVAGLDAKSYLRFQRRLCRLYNTDEAVSKILQLMRLPGTLNTKRQEDQPLCELQAETDMVYTAEELDKLLPPITQEDEKFCQQHYDKTYSLESQDYKISETMPLKWGKLLHENDEVKTIWSGNADDRSKNDFRLGHIMYAQGFTKEEAVTVLANSAKASQRAPIHRISYATNIVDKIWVYEEQGPSSSPTVRELLSKGEETIKGTRFPCSKLIDDTEHGFRLGQVIGIVAGSGVGKTTLTLNAFLWFAENNPDYHHFFFSLEMPAGEIASRIKLICGDNQRLYDKIHVIDNHDSEGKYINFSLKTIEEHIMNFKSQTGFNVGAIVVDHIGVLDKQSKNGENDGLIGVCRAMKPLAITTNTLVIMLSQAPREKAGIGDLELNKDAAYGTVAFESYCDYLLCLWQPLKRMYTQGAPTIMAFKFAKIRHKKQNKDRIKEDVCYQFFFDTDNERLREVTQEEEKSATYWVSQATNARKADRKTDIVKYESRRVIEEPKVKDGTRTTNNH